MTEQLYRVYSRIVGDAEVHRSDPTTRANAERDYHSWVEAWDGMIDFWIEPYDVIPPPYTPPAITAEMDLETRAGSPRGVESDFLGLP